MDEIRFIGKQLTAVPGEAGRGDGNRRRRPPVISW
jgi:hypothetical protein